MVVQPFKAVEGLSTMKYTAIFASDTNKGFLEDRERYTVFVEMSPWDKVVNCSCECKGFIFGKGKWCKHIDGSKVGYEGLMQLLIKWREIQSIPENEQETTED